jgi:hypothetical protein
MLSGASLSLKACQTLVSAPQPSTMRLMGHQIFHPRDEQLLQDIDGELSSRDTRSIQPHLRACWRCRTRRHQLECAITTFIRGRRPEFDDRLPSETGPRELLRSRLVELPGQRFIRYGWWHWRVSAQVCSGAAFCALTLISLDRHTA